MNLEEEIKEKFTEDTIKNLLFLSGLALKQSKITLALMLDNIYSEKFKQQAYKEYRIDKLWYEEAVKAKNNGLIDDCQFLDIEDIYLTAGLLVKKYTDFLNN